MSADILLNCGELRPSAARGMFSSIQHCDPELFDYMFDIGLLFDIVH